MFKKRVVSKSNIRQKRPLDSDDKNNSHINALQGGNEVITSTGNGNEEDVREELEEETREDGLAEALALRKLRQQAKSKGVDAMALLTASTSKDGDESAAATAAADSAAAADPLWDLRNGGLVTREMLDQKKA